jgi:hypothetical protein
MVQTRGPRPRQASGSRPSARLLLGAMRLLDVVAHDWLPCPSPLEVLIAEHLAQPPSRRVPCAISWSSRASTTRVRTAAAPAPMSASPLTSALRSGSTAMPRNPRPVAAAAQHRSAALAHTAGEDQPFHAAKRRRHRGDAGAQAVHIGIQRARVGSPCAIPASTARMSAVPASANSPDWCSSASASSRSAAAQQVGSRPSRGGRRPARALGRGGQ